MSRWCTQPQVNSRQVRLNNTPLLRRSATSLIWVMVPGAELLCALLCAFAAYFPLTDGDIWWHLASAREMLARGAFLRAEPFAFTPTAPWVNLHWLFQLGAYGLYSLGGAWALVAAKCFLFGTACAVMARTFASSGRQRLLVLGAMALGAFSVRYLVLARPTVVTLVYLAVELALIEAFCRTGRRAWLWPVLLVQVAWVNTQGLFALGLAVMAVYVAGCGLGVWLVSRGVVVCLAPGVRDRHAPLTLAATLGGALICCLVNPYGVQALLLPLRLFTRIEPSLRTVFSQNVSENVPTLDLLAGPDAGYAWAAITVALTGLAVFVVARRAVRVEHAFLFLAFLYLGFTAERNVLLFVFVSVPLVAAYAAQALQESRSGVRQAVSVAAAVTLSVALAWHLRRHADVVRHYPRHSAVSPMRFPDEAVAYLRAHPLPGRIFNADRFGGYLIWRLYPPRQVYIDGRFVLRTPAFFAEYLRAYDQPESFDTLAARYGITHALLQTAFFDRYLPLAYSLYHDPRWRLVLADGASALFVRDSLAPTPRVELADPQVREAVESRLQTVWRDDPLICAEAVARFRRFARLMTGPSPTRALPVCR